jgi:hypothetical protein
MVSCGEHSFPERQVIPGSRLGVPNGIRTRVSGVKSRGPGPLDDGDSLRPWSERAGQIAGRGVPCNLHELTARLGRGERWGRRLFVLVAEQ